MRVLWFTNGPIGAAAARAGMKPASGHWMWSLLEHARLQAPEIEFGVATAHPGMRDDRFSEDGIEYFVHGQPKFHSIFACRPADLDWAASLAREWHPDLIHIHGTERFYGLLPARRLVDTPAVISVQGFLETCVDSFFGALKLEEIWQSQRIVELATRRGVLWRYREFKTGREQEREILRGARVFLGRTAWDRAVVSAHSPSADYHHVGEVLRAPFFHARWSLDGARRHSVLFTNSGEPRRCNDVLLRAVAVLLREFPDTKLRLAGGFGGKRGYDNFLHKLIAENGLAKAVEPLGYLDAKSLAAELSQSHVFVHPSIVENSSNALCEAMQVGVPAVAAYAAGNPDIVEHGRTGLLAAPCDPVALAAAIGQVFRDDRLAACLSETARNVATARHAPSRVVSELLGAYNHVISRNHSR